MVMTKQVNSQRRVQFSPPDISEIEIQEVIEALKSGWITTGPRTKKFEKELCTFIGVENCVCLNSATAAEELNLRVLGIGDGDEVIVPAYTYTASASAAIHTGAKVVFVDSKKDSLEMDYEALEKAITDKTKAIIPVDLGGVICDYNTILQIINKKKDLFTPSNDIQQAMGRIAIVADCAHAIGAVKDGHKAGTQADFSSFSFHAVKNLTTAEGGASVWKHIEGVDDNEIYHLYQLYSLHGQSKDALAKTQLGAWEYDIVGPWYKCNMTDIMAAIGLKQLERYPELINRRHEIIQMYDKAMDQLGVYHIQHLGTDYKGSGHLYITRVPGINEKQRSEIITRMAERGIACNVHYKPLPMMTAYKNLGFDIKDYPNAYDFFSNEITLPLHTLLTDEDVEYVITNYVEIVKDYL